MTVQPSPQPQNTPPPSGRVVLSVRDVTIEYKSRRGMLKAVRNASFDLKAGEVLALIGESGSGKTTLGLGLIRLLPGTALLRSGDIRFYRYGKDGQQTKTIDIARESPKNLRKFRWQQCAMVFQSALNSLNPVLKISDQFIDTAKDHNLKTGKEFVRQAYELLRMVRLDPDRVWDSYAHELSGGMRQRVIIALALLLRPDVIIMDEPTTALDILTQRSIINLLKELKEQLGFSMIFISHDLSLAAELADRIATMYAGRIIEEADVFTTFKRPHHPYTLGLIRAVPTLTSDDSLLTSIPGSPPDLIHMPSGCKFHPRCTFAASRCSQEEPPTEEIAPGHRVACWNWKEVALTAHGEVREQP